MTLRDWALPLLFGVVLAMMGLAGWYGRRHPAGYDGPTGRELCKAEMSLEQFWLLVDASATGEDTYRVQRLQYELNALTPTQLLGFELSFRSRLDEAHSWNLWGAVHVANGGASDDGFEYFRDWLISRGRTEFERVVRQPDDLADIVPADARHVLELEDFGNGALERWMEKTGLEEARAADRLRASNCHPRTDWQSSTPFETHAPTGSSFRSLPTELEKRYPKVWRRFGEHPIS